MYFFFRAKRIFSLECTKKGTSVLVTWFISARNTQVMLNKKMKQNNKISCQKFVTSMSPNVNHRVSKPINALWTSWQRKVSEKKVPKDVVFSMMYFFFLYFTLTQRYEMNHGFKSRFAVWKNSESFAFEVNVCCLRWDSKPRSWLKEVY